MISHLRYATANPNYRPPPALKKNKGIKSAQSDRTAVLQQQLLGLGQCGLQGNIRHLVTGDVPLHVGGRGHLEGTCLAKGEGLLESRKNRGPHDDPDDTYDSDEEEEERKVWKPLSGIGMTKHDPKANPKANPKAKKGSDPKEPKEPNNPNPKLKPKPKPKSEETLEGLDADIQSLKNEELDWSRGSKHGKKSNENFQKWLDGVARIMHNQQVTSEDSLFAQF